jgi:MoxR-like ATPase
VQDIAEISARIHQSVGQVIKGKPQVIDLAIASLLADGHLLVEDVPGVGKTSLARALAATIDASWSRVQFTPDLLPSDVTGGEIYREQSGTFEFHKGPVFAHVVIADEINRASPKTQSALLEVMEERSVTVGGNTHPLPLPFLVVATQNPIEMDGTYRLPEAQLDRFLMKISVGYPDAFAEAEVLTGDGSSHTMKHVNAVTDTDELRGIIERVNEVAVAPALVNYIVELVAATRKLPELRLGASPRGALALMRAARAHAAMQGRNHATADDVKHLAESVLAHRLLLNSQATLSQVTAEALVRRVLATVAVPSNVE